MLNLTSTAGLSAYEGGGGYNAAKFAQHALTGALRLEEAEHNLRVIEVAPGLVQTEEFALNRLGDQDAAAKVYQGVEKPLTAEDVADVVRYAVVAPHHINLDQIVIRPVAQAANYKLIRKNPSGQERGQGGARGRDIRLRHLTFTEAWGAGQAALVRSWPGLGKVAHATAHHQSGELSHANPDEARRCRTQRSPAPRRRCPGKRCPGKAPRPTRPTRTPTARATTLTSRPIEAASA